METSINKNSLLKEGHNQNHMPNYLQDQNHYQDYSNKKIDNESEAKRIYNKINRK